MAAAVTLIDAVRLLVARGEEAMTVTQNVPRPQQLTECLQLTTDTICRHI